MTVMLVTILMMMTILVMMIILVMISTINFTTSSTNGKRVCSTQLRNNCLGGFKVGGNCNNQQVVLKNIKCELRKLMMVEDDDGDDDQDDADEVDNNDPLHQRLDSSRLPPSEFQMGTEQGGGAVDTR